MEKEPLSVLVVEDDEDDFFIARRLLSKANAVEPQIDWHRSYEEGLAACLDNAHDVALVDYRLGARNGLELLVEAIDQGSTIPIILLTGQGDREVDLQAMTAGAADYLVKWEFDAQLLERSIRYARERRRAEERIREQAAFLDKARDAISAYNLDKQVVYWNKSSERLYGWTAEEMMGKPAEEYLAGADTPMLEEAYEAVREHGEWAGEMRQKTKDGNEVIVESRWTLVRDNAGNPKSILIINTDITERKALETQFLRAQRMESIGRLVSGIAHDLGNLLVPILLGVKVLKQRFSDDEKVMRTLNMMYQSGQRGSDMVKQVLAFARGVQGERVTFGPTPVIREVEKMVSETFSSNIELEAAVPDDLWMVLGDATQLQQVLMNLCVNARDAMPDGGRLTIQAENLVITPTLARMNLDAKPGEYVKISVSDTGEGIPQEVQDKIFEPFFTTKPTGKGTGLGLSTVYSIVKSHNGFISLFSEEGVGTSFHIFLPMSEEEEPVRRQETEVEMQGGRGELVLVVDDEPFILEVARDILESSGYRVVTASNGREALDVFQEHQADIAAVITDLVMPEMGGVATIEALRKARPTLPIIAASGMANGKSQEAVDAGARTFLSKPFTAEKLCSALEDVLAR